MFTQQTSMNSNVNIEKIKKGLKRTGDSVYAVGWLTIIYNIAAYLLSIFYANYASLGLPRPDLSGTTLMIIFGTIFIILGKRISALNDIYMERYFKILLTFSFIIFIWILASGGKVGILLFLVIGYLISSLLSFRKTKHIEAFSSSLSHPKHTINKKGWIIFTIVSLFTLLITGLIDISTLHGNTDKTTDSISINDIVKEAKANMTLPKRVDESSTLVDITAEPNAIRYHYTIDNIDTTKLNNNNLKANLVETVCKNQDTRTLLNRNINLEYAYTTNAEEKFFVSISKADCL